MSRLIIFLFITIIHSIYGLDSNMNFQSKHSSKYNNSFTNITSNSLFHPITILLKNIQMYKHTIF